MEKADRRPVGLPIKGCDDVLRDGSALQRPTRAGLGDLAVIGREQKNELEQLGDARLLKDTLYVKKHYFSINRYEHIGVNSSLHIILGSERKLVTAAEIVQTYATVNSILGKVKERLGLNDNPLMKMQKLYAVIDQIAAFKKCDLLTLGLGKTPAVFDCDVASYIFMVVAEELQWPVKLVRAEGHMYVVWQGGDEDNDLFFETTNGQKRAMDKRDKILERNGFYAHLFLNRGISYSRKFRDYERSVKEYSKGIRLDEDATLRFNRARTLEALGEWDLAEVDYRRAYELDPAYMRVKQQLEKLENEKLQLMKIPTQAK
jgi:tetratricopeptide (TPR) repeat protein